MSHGTAACACMVALYGAYANEAPTCLPTRPLTELYYCEECCALRCNECVAWEVSTTFCSNCLFEVPDTSVRAQKARCSRTCFECPVCMHVLSIVGSDPPRREVPLTAPEASLGVAPFYLSCACCRWDSKRLGLVAERPTDLSQVFDAMEHSAWPEHEWARLTEHITPEVEANIAERSHRTRRARARHTPSMPPYEPHMSNSLIKYASRVQRQAELVRHDMPHVTTLDQRWAMPCEQPYQSTALRPRRVRLMCKYSKRCAKCRHILVRPEPRTNSSAFKIKLLASQFLPQVSVLRGANELWTLALTNPLMDAMDVLLKCGAGDVSAHQIRLPAFVDVFDIDDDSASHAPGAEWDGFQHGLYTHRNQVFVSVRTRPNTPILPLQIEWNVPDTQRSHTFWTLVSLT